MTGVIAPAEAIEDFEKEMMKGKPPYRGTSAGSAEQKGGVE